jgi:hypothetical protein
MEEIGIIKRMPGVIASRNHMQYVDWINDALAAKREMV